MILQAILAFSSSAMPVKLPVERHFNRYDFALYAGVVAYRAGDYITTERNVSRPNHYEWELPEALVANKAGFAAYSGFLAAAEIGASIYLHKHGHAKLARFADSISVGSGTATDISNVLAYKGGHK